MSDFTYWWHRCDHCYQSPCNYISPQSFCLHSVICRVMRGSNEGICTHSAPQSPTGHVYSSSSRTPTMPTRFHCIGSLGGHLHSAGSAFDLKDLQRRQRRAQKSKAAQADGTPLFNFVDRSTEKPKYFFSVKGLAFVTNINPGLPPLLILVITLHLHFSFTPKSSQILLRINIGNGLFEGLKAAVSGLKFQDYSSGILCFTQKELKYFVRIKYFGWVII